MFYLLTYKKAKPNIFFSIETEIKLIESCFHRYFHLLWQTADSLTQLDFNLENYII